MYDVSKKIEEIRKKPDHERLRYVWSAVIISMFFIFIIWIFSIKASFQKKNDAQAPIITPDLTEQIQKVKDSAPSITDFVNQTEDAPALSNKEGIMNQ